MSDAPEKIWADLDYQEWTEIEPDGTGETLYVRADTIPSAAYVAGLEAALSEISNRHIPDQPAAYGGDELEWAVRQHTELRKIARAALASRPASPDVRVAVKPLEWGPYPNREFDNPDVAVADAPFNHRYHVQMDPWAHTYIACLHPRLPIIDSTLWWEGKGHETLEAAKAAAQADYERRILSAIIGCQT